MIGKSLPEYLFIRTLIFLLRAVPVLACIYTAARFLLVVPWPYIPAVLEYWLVIECIFYIFYVARGHYLQKTAPHPPQSSQARRRELFERCLAHAPDADKYIAGWFSSPDRPLDIRRNNLFDWILWAFFATDHPDDLAVVEELDEYIAKIEAVIGRKIEPGRNKSIKPIRLTLDPVVIRPRPVIWYMVVAIIDCVTYASLHTRGFRHYTSFRIKVFPPRPQTFFSRWSIAPNFPYWYRPHRSPSKRPVVMLHGIGIGLWTYAAFLQELSAIDPDVGILVLEILPISMRITFPMPSQAQFIEQLTHILVLHNIVDFVLVAHSYGSALTTHILHSPLAPRVASVVLVDPVSLLLHRPAVAYNFVYRAPRTANEWQLWYFASRDMGIAHTLSRHFSWSDNILWKEELAGRQAGVVLSGQDQIVETREVWKYLTGLNEEEPRVSWKDDKGDLNILWYAGLDHAQVFDTPERRRPILDLLEKFITYC